MQAIADARDREAWLAARSKGVGASEVAAILGCSPWGSAIEVWARKTGRAAPIESSERMRWGSRLEAQILAGYAEEHRRRVEPAQQLLADADEPHLLATPDGFDLGSLDADEPWGCIETKLTSQARWDEAPLYYQIQLQVQLAVTGHTWGAVVALHGNELGVYRYDRHEKAIARIRAAVAFFWREYVERDREPPAQSPADSAALAALHPKDSGATVQLGEDLAQLVDEWGDVKAQIAALYERKDSIEGRLKQALGDATWGALPTGKRLQWKVEARKEHVVKASEPRVLRLVKGA